jgi:hypothetical protein
VGKSETELRYEQEQADREEKERLAQDNQTSVNPQAPNLLHQGAPPRSESTFVQGRLAGVPIKGPPSNIHPSELDSDDDEDKQMAKLMGDLESPGARSKNSNASGAAGAATNAAASTAHDSKVATNANGAIMGGSSLSGKGFSGGLSGLGLGAGEFGANTGGNTSARENEKGTGVLGGFPSKPQPFGSVNNALDEFGEAAGSRYSRVS